MSVMPINNTAEGNAGFSTGFDSLDGLLSGYFAFENFKQGKELQDAQIQQARLENSVSVDQQINEQVNAQRGTLAVTSNGLVYIGLGLVAAVLLMRFKA